MRSTVIPGFASINCLTSSSDSSFCWYMTVSLTASPLAAGADVAAGAAVAAGADVAAGAAVAAGAEVAPAALPVGSSAAGLAPPQAARSDPPAPTASMRRKLRRLSISSFLERFMVPVPPLVICLCSDLRYNSRRGNSRPRKAQARWSALSKSVRPRPPKRMANTLSCCTPMLCSSSGARAALDQLGLEQDVALHSAGILDILNQQPGGERTDLAHRLP